MKIYIGLAALVAAASPLYGQASPPKPVSPETWFTENDYPAEASAANAQGAVATELAVDISGRVTGCKIVRSSGSAILDQRTCRILVDRGRFTVARNEHGQPAAGTYAWRMKWGPPPAAPDPFAGRQVLRPQLSETRFWYPAGVRALVLCTAEQDGKYDPTGAQRCEREKRSLFENYLQLAAIRLNLAGNLRGIESYQVLVGTTARPAIPPMPDRERVLSQRISYIDVDATGRLANCRFEPSGPLAANAPASPNDPCKRGMLVRPLLDGAGKPAAGRLVIVYRLTARSFTNAEVKALHPNWAF